MAAVPAARMLMVVVSLHPWESWADECPNVPPVGTATADEPLQASSSERLLAGHFVVRPPRSTEALADILGLDSAKAVLREAVVLPASAPAGAARLFWRSRGVSAALLAGPAGLGKVSAAEAAAVAAGAQVLQLMATEAIDGAFCKVAIGAAESAGQPVVVIIEALEAARGASLAIRQCLHQVGARDALPVFLVATANDGASSLGVACLAPFGYIARLRLPDTSERKQALLRLLGETSRVDARWASALPEAAVDTLAGLTENYTFAELDLVVRRAFLLSSVGEEGVRDPVALHHFEKILAGMAPHALLAEHEPQQAAGQRSSPSPPSEAKKGGTEGTKKRREGKDPMDAIFGWCNFWLPEALHLPPVVWAMTIFGILAHFMARSTYQPYQRKRRGVSGGGPGSRAGGGLFGDMGGTGHPYPGFGDGAGDWFPGGSPLGTFPPPPGATDATVAGGASPSSAPAERARGAPAASEGAPSAAGSGASAAAGVTPAAASGGLAQPKGEAQAHGPKASRGLGQALRSPPTGGR